MHETVSICVTSTKGWSIRYLQPRKNSLALSEITEAYRTGVLAVDQTPLGSIRYSHSMLV